MAAVLACRIARGTTRCRTATSEQRAHVWCCSSTSTTDRGTTSNPTSTTPSKRCLRWQPARSTRRGSQTGFVTGSRSEFEPASRSVITGRNSSRRARFRRSQCLDPQAPIRFDPHLGQIVRMHRNELMQHRDTGDPRSTTPHRCSGNPHQPTGARSDFRDQDPSRPQCSPEGGSVTTLTVKRQQVVDTHESPSFC